MSLFTTRVKFITWLFVTAAFIGSLFVLFRLGPYYLRGVDATGIITGASNECYNVSYLDSASVPRSVCLGLKKRTKRKIDSLIGSEIKLRYLPETPWQATINGVGGWAAMTWILLLLGATTFGVPISLWWYGWRLRRWADSAGVVLKRIYLTTIWSNPFGPASGFSRSMLTFRVLVVESSGAELVAWVKFGSFWFYSPKVEVLWEKRNPGEDTLEMKAAKVRSDRVRPSKNPNEELLF